MITIFMVLMMKWSYYKYTKINEILIFKVKQNFQHLNSFLNFIIIAYLIIFFIFRENVLQKCLTIYFTITVTIAFQLPGKDILLKGKNFFNINFEIY